MDRPEVIVVDAKCQKHLDSPTYSMYGLCTNCGTNAMFVFSKGHPATPRPCPYCGIKIEVLTINPEQKE